MSSRLQQNSHNEVMEKVKDTLIRTKETAACLKGMFLNAFVFKRLNKGGLEPLDIVVK